MDQIKNNNSKESLSEETLDQRMALAPHAADRIRICPACCDAKALSEFYLKEGRRDNNCKCCRRLQRRKRYQKSGSPSDQAMSNDATEIAEVQAEDSTQVAQSNPVLSEDILKLAEAFLLLEAWQADLDAQQELSNSK